MTLNRVQRYKIFGTFGQNYMIILLFWGNLTLCLTVIIQPTSLLQDKPFGFSYVSRASPMVQE